MKKMFTLALSAMMLISAGSFAQKADTLKKRVRGKAKTAMAKADKKAAETQAAAASATDAAKAKADKKAAAAQAKAEKKAAETKAAATNATSAASAEAAKKAAETKAAATKAAATNATGAASAAVTKKAAAAKTYAEGVNKSADKAIGKDAKGRTIYQGPKGGQYTISESGKKQYIKVADKLKVN